MDHMFYTLGALVKTSNMTSHYSTAVPRVARSHAWVCQLQIGKIAYAYDGPAPELVTEYREGNYSHRR